MKRLGVLIGAAILFVGVGGCGEKTASVSGKVVFDQKPLPAARIVFTNEKGKSVQGEVIDGEYSVSGVPVGEKVTVTISTAALAQEVAHFEEKKRFAAGPGHIPASQLPKGVEPPPEMLAQHDASQMPEDLVKRMEELKRRLIAIPPRYQNEKTTPLTFKIEGGAQEIDITLDKQ